MPQEKKLVGEVEKGIESMPANIRPDETQSPLPPVPSSCFSKPVSLADLLKARKLVKPKNQIICTLYLEKYNVAKKEWETLMDSEKFSEGGFRDAFKQYKDDKMEAITEYLKISPENHTRKQVQMHAVARSIVLSFARKAPTDLVKHFLITKCIFQC